MALREFNLEGVRLVDNGTVEAAFNKLLSDAVRDCSDRPGMEAGREVTLTVKIKPVLHSQGSLDHVIGIVTLKGKRPNYETPEIHFEARQRAGTHQLVWNDLSADDPRQRTIDELDRDDV